MPGQKPTEAIWSQDTVLPGKLKRRSSLQRNRFGRGICGSWRVGFRNYRRFQNSKDLLVSQVGHAKIFNFSPETYKLPNSISGYSSNSPDSNHTKCVNYECLDLKEIGVIFPSLRDA